MGKSVFMKRLDGFSQKLQYTVMGKNKHGEGGRFKDNEFSGVK